MTRAQVIDEAEKLRERDSLRDILARQIADGRAIGYLGRADGAEYEYLIEAAVSRAHGMVAIQETTFDAQTRKVVSVTFYDAEAARGARGFVGRDNRPNAAAWIDAYDRIQRAIAEREANESRAA